MCNQVSVKKGPEAGNQEALSLSFPLLPFCPYVKTHVPVPPTPTRVLKEAFCYPTKDIQA